MVQIGLEKLRVYQLAEEIADLVWEVACFRKILEELAPKLSAYINSIGRKNSGWTTDN